ncbi:CAMK/CAMKL/PASK protein kinase [Kwoniella heveanensis CBS 569]|uniref:CAMK/CAMKL/PASK protein kinase n=1 Tax=Kwoniella heveanensis BCC8398 TaxID=1296120 RepID=A0A1B9GZU5_9TREE|nr:CAMK/CAMKL/PASK protein kinase [Kwoniella heveanensis BCC8398]OCF45454.1 CAMK/CAMKL/PASK protein kinase [Kwoniella heveanensis CBS 569]
MSPNRNRKAKSPSLGQAVFYPASLPPPLRRPSKALPPYTARAESPTSPSPLYASLSNGVSTPPRLMTASPDPRGFERYESGGEFPFPTQASAAAGAHVSPTRKLTHLFDGLTFATPPNGHHHETYNRLLYSAGSEPELNITTPSALPLSDLIDEALIEEDQTDSDSHSQPSPTVITKAYNVSTAPAFIPQDSFTFPRPPPGVQLPKHNSFKLGSPPRQSFSPQSRLNPVRQPSWSEYGQRRASPPELNLKVNQPTYAPPSPLSGGAISPMTVPSPLPDHGGQTDYLFPTQNGYDDIFSPSYQLHQSMPVPQANNQLFTPPYTDSPLPAPSNNLQLHHPSLFPSAPVYQAVVPSQPASSATPSPEPAKSEVAAMYLENRQLCPSFSRRYIIRDELGSGGFGFVCSALQTGYKNVPGVEVAVKFIFKDRISECDYAMLEGEPVESYVLSRVQHPNIIGFKDLFEDDEFFYLVQELHGDPWAPGHTLEVPDTIQNPALPPTPAPHPVPIIHAPQTPGSAFVFSPVHSVDWSKLSPFSGEAGKRPNMARRASYDLFECVEHQRFSEEQSRNIFRQIVDAVSYLHNKGIYHRDLKDENIVIDRNLCVKIIDFGSAVIEDRSYPPVLYDHFRGTMSYAAAEVLNGRHYHAGPADVWSLGIILGIILTGESPFPNTTWAQEGRIKIKRQVPGGAFDLMQKCLCTDPRRRATIEQVERHPWLRGMLAHRGSIC